VAEVIRGARVDPERLLLARSGRARPDPRETTASMPLSVAAPSGAADPSVTPTPAAVATPFEAQRRDFLERLETERLAVLERAQAEGYAAGWQQGESAHSQALQAHAQAMLAHDEAMAALGTLLASARDALQAGIAGMEEVLVEIVFEATGRLLGEALRDGPGVIAVVRQVLLAAGEHERLRVRVSPADHERLAHEREHLLPGGDASTIELVADARVVLGGCLVEAAGGTIDGRLETQLQRLIDTLVAARRLPPEASA
jgi:flagellar assembly protein FliH